LPDGQPAFRRQFAHLAIANPPHPDVCELPNGAAPLKNNE
jgi:hypothetical protein